MKECIDITEHYLNIATPGFGEIIKQEGYNDSLHSNEISMAEWIINTLGGDVVLLNEKNLDNVKTPDFLWHDKHWDLKDVSSLKAVDNAVRKGLRQIKDNLLSLSQEIRSLQFLDIKNENTPSPIRVKVCSHLFYTILFPDYQPQF